MGGCALGGCGGGSTATLTSTGSLPTAKAHSTVGKQSSSDAAAGANAGPVKVALLLPLSATGQTAVIAKAMRQAAELALFERNATELQLIVKDDKGTESGAVAAVDAALKEGAEIILGPLFSRSVAAIAPAAKAAGVSIVAFSNDPSLARNGVYLIGFTAAAEIDRSTAYAVSQNRRRFAALIPDDAEGRVLEPVFRAAVARAGGSVVVIERFSIEANGLAEPMQRLNAALKNGTSGAFAADALFIPGGQDTLPQIDALMPQIGLDAQQMKLIGTSGWDFPSVHRLSNLQGAWFAAPDPLGWREFAERFGRSYGAMPPRLASFSHDAVVMASTLASSPKATRFSGPELTRGSGFVGADGAFRLRATGLVERSLAILELQKSGPVVVDAAAPVSVAPLAAIPPPVSAPPAAPLVPSVVRVGGTPPPGSGIN